MLRLFLITMLFFPCFSGILYVHLPLCKLFLPLLTLIEGQNIRKNTAGYRLDLMLWNGGVID